MTPWFSEWLYAYNSLAVTIYRYQLLRNSPVFEQNRRFQDLMNRWLIVSLRVAQIVSDQCRLSTHYELSGIDMSFIEYADPAFDTLNERDNPTTMNNNLINLIGLMKSRINFTLERYEYIDIDNMPELSDYLQAGHLAIYNDVIGTLYDKPLLRLCNTVIRLINSVKKAKPPHLDTIHDAFKEINQENDKYIRVLKQMTIPSYYTWNESIAGTMRDYLRQVRNLLVDLATRLDISQGHYTKTSTYSPPSRFMTSGRFSLTSTRSGGVPPPSPQRSSSAPPRALYHLQSPQNISVSMVSPPIVSSPVLSPTLQATPSATLLPSPSSPMVTISPTMTIPPIASPLAIQLPHRLISPRPMTPFKRTPKKVLKPVFVGPPLDATQSQSTPVIGKKSKSRRLTLDNGEEELPSPITPTALFGTQAGAPPQETKIQFENDGSIPHELRPLFVKIYQQLHWLGEKWFPLVKQPPLLSQDESHDITIGESIVALKNMAPDVYDTTYFPSTASYFAHCIKLFTSLYELLMNVPTNEPSVSKRLNVLMGFISDPQDWIFMTVLDIEYYTFLPNHDKRYVDWRRFFIKAIINRHIEALEGELGVDADGVNEKKDKYWASIATTPFNIVALPTQELRDNYLALQNRLNQEATMPSPPKDQSNYFAALLASSTALAAGGTTLYYIIRGLKWLVGGDEAIATPSPSLATTLPSSPTPIPVAVQKVAHDMAASPNWGLRTSVLLGTAALTSYFGYQAWQRGQQTLSSRARTIATSYRRQSQRAVPVQSYLPTMTTVVLPSLPPAYPAAPKSAPVRRRASHSSKKPASSPRRRHRYSPSQKKAPQSPHRKTPVKKGATLSNYRTPRRTRRL